MRRGQVQAGAGPASVADGCILNANRCGRRLYPQRQPRSLVRNKQLTVIRGLDHACRPALADDLQLSTGVGHVGDGCRWHRPLPQLGRQAVQAQQHVRDRRRARLVLQAAQVAAGGRRVVLLHQLR